MPPRTLRHLPLFLSGIGAPALCVALSLALGARSAPLSTVLDALSGPTEGRDALVVTGLRLPRTVVGLAVGAALLVPGCLIAGPLLLLTADILGRLVIRPAELEVGIVTSFLGAPLPALLARKVAR